MTPLHTWPVGAVAPSGMRYPRLVDALAQSGALLFLVQALDHELLEHGLVARVALGCQGLGSRHDVVAQNNRIGVFGQVGARLACRWQGLTRAVLLEGLRRMQAHGMDRVCVFTGVSNSPALRLYESVGFRIVNRYLDYVKTE